MNKPNPADIFAPFDTTASPPAEAPTKKRDRKKAEPAKVHTPVQTPVASESVPAVTVKKGPRKPRAVRVPTNDQVLFMDSASLMILRTLDVPICNSLITMLAALKPLTPADRRKVHELVGKFLRGYK